MYLGIAATLKQKIHDIYWRDTEMGGTPNWQENKNKNNKVPTTLLRN